MPGNSAELRDRNIHAENESIQAILPKSAIDLGIYRATSLDELANPDTKSIALWNPQLRHWFVFNRVLGRSDFVSSPFFGSSPIGRVLLQEPDHYIDKPVYTAVELEKLISSGEVLIIPDQPSARKSLDRIAGLALADASGEKVMLAQDLIVGQKIAACDSYGFRSGTVRSKTGNRISLDDSEGNDLFLFGDDMVLRI
jgi:hypothetical protein